MSPETAGIKFHYCIDADIYGKTVIDSKSYNQPLKEVSLFRNYTNKRREQALHEI